MASRNTAAKDASFRGNKQSLPQKPCAACGRPMTWRKRDMPASSSRSFLSARSSASAMCVRLQGDAFSHEPLFSIPLSPSDDDDESIESFISFIFFDNDDDDDCCLERPESFDDISCSLDGTDNISRCVCEDDNCGSVNDDDDACVI
jgi:hypothetical protein